MRRTLHQTAAQSMLLDASAYQTFVLIFGTSVSDLQIKNISPGQLYCFVLVQDAKGNHDLAWGDDARNGTQINLQPHSVTVQMFIGMMGGYVQAVPPGTWRW